MFENLQLEYGRYRGFSLSNSADVTIQNSNIHSFLGTGLSLTGVCCLISKVQIQWIGCSAAAVSGGNVYTLAYGNNTIQQSNFSLYARWTRTYNPGCSISGVGQKMISCNMSNAPQNGVLASGNQHLWQYNTFYNLCMETSDAGAWYMGRSFTQRGNVIDSNTFINILRVAPITNPNSSPYIWMMSSHV